MTERLKGGILNINLYKMSNEITRKFEEIMAERDDPDFKEKERIRKIRKENIENSDEGL